LIGADTVVRADGPQGHICACRKSRASSGFRMNDEQRTLANGPVECSTGPFPDCGAGLATGCRRLTQLGAPLTLPEHPIVDDVEGIVPLGKGSERFPLFARQVATTLGNVRQ
jgi:hypothetical protein